MGNVKERNMNFQVSIIFAIGFEMFLHEIFFVWSAVSQWMMQVIVGNLEIHWEIFEIKLNFKGFGDI